MGCELTYIITRAQGDKALSVLRRARSFRSSGESKPGWISCKMCVPAGWPSVEPPGWPPLLDHCCGRCQTKATSRRTPKYLPLPQPTSATIAPAGRLSRNSLTLGHTANLGHGVHIASITTRPGAQNEERATLRHSSELALRDGCCQRPLQALQPACANLHMSAFPAKHRHVYEASWCSHVGFTL